MSKVRNGNFNEKLREDNVHNTKHARVFAASPVCIPPPLVVVSEGLSMRLMIFMTVRTHVSSACACPCPCPCPCVVEEDKDEVDIAARKICVALDGTW